MSATCCSCFVAAMRQRGLFGPGRTDGLFRRKWSHAGGALCNAVNRNAPPSYRSRLPNLASQMRTAFSSIALNTGSSSPGELLITLSTSAVAVCCCNDSRSSFSRRAFSIAITACAAKFRSEHGLQLAGRAADHLEHVGCGGLLLQRFPELV